MKVRKISAMLVGAMILSVLAGCGKSEDTAIKEMQGRYSQYVTLGQYKGVEYTPQNTEVTDDDIQSAIDNLISQNTIPNNVYDKTATMGDAVNIDYVGSIDGEEFEGGNTQGAGTEITLGSSGYIDNFDEQIAGHTPGDSFDVNVTFPDDYQNADLAGKAAVFATTLNFIVGEPTVPEYDDVLVASATDYKTTSEFESAKRTELEEQNEKSDLESNKATLMKKVMDASNVSEYPEQEITERMQSIIDNVTESAESNGIDLATYLSYYGYDEEGFKTQIKQSVEDYIREKMVVVTIAEAEKIEVTEEEVEAKKQELLDQTGLQDIEALKKTYGYDDEDFSYEIIYDKVRDFVYNNAVQVEATATDASASDGAMVDDYGTDDE